MKKTYAWMGAALTALGVIGFANTASASSHREAPATSMDPNADNTDWYAWTTGTVGSTTIHMVGSYIPFEEPSGGPNYFQFADDVLYEFHVARGDGQLTDVATYQFRFTTVPAARVEPGPSPVHTNFVVPPDPVDMAGAHLSGVEFFSQISGASQTYSVTKVTYDANGAPTATVVGTGLKIAPSNIGPRTNAVAYTALYGLDPAKGYDDAFAAKFISPLTVGTSWAGQRDDGFYVDTGAIFDLANLRATGIDNISHFNVHAISLDVPESEIPPAATGPTGNKDPLDANLLGTWASASRRKVRILRNDGSTQGFGPWVQVSRLGLPLINEAVIGLQDKDKYNRTQPVNDVRNYAGYFLNPVLVRDAEAVGIYKKLGVPDATVQMLKTNRLDIIAVIDLDMIAGMHKVPITAGTVGDVLRLDIGQPSGFPNGRIVGGGAKPNQEADVTDIELSLLAAGSGSLSGPLPVGDGVSANDKPYLLTQPYLALPWEGYTDGHGQPETPQ